MQKMQKIQKNERMKLKVKVKVNVKVKRYNKYITRYIKMPSQTYDIKFREGDFFYNTVKPNENTNSDLLQTFPFKKSDVVKWANKVAKPSVPIVSESIDDIFDPQISDIIMNPEYDFANSFLKGNMVFNDQFNQIAFDLTNPPANSQLDKKNLAISGNISIASKNSEIPSLDISSGNINWSQDVTNSWQPNFDIDAKLSKDIPFIDTDGGKSYVTVTTKNPRCKYRKDCTINHLHYAGGCEQIITTDPNGDSICKCKCWGEQVASSDPHFHCEEYNVNPDGTGTNPDGTVTAPAGLGLLQMIQGIKLNLTAQFDKPKFGAAGEKVTLDYDDIDTLEENNKKIRDMVLEYYKQVYENIQIQKEIKVASNKDGTMSQSMMDATAQYKSEYLNVFNIIVGVFCVSGYIYILGKK